MKLLKLFESILKAAAALGAAVISVFKIIDNMETKKHNFGYMMFFVENKSKSSISI